MQFGKKKNITDVTKAIPHILVYYFFLYLL